MTAVATRHPSWDHGPGPPPPTERITVDVKKVLLLVGAAVLIYTLIAHPTSLADGVQMLFAWLLEGLKAIWTFLREVLNGLSEMLA